MERPILAGVPLFDGGDLLLSGEQSGEQADALVELRTRQLLAAGACSCLIGGEHALTRAALRGAAAACNSPLALVFLDAHSDLGLSHWGGRYPRDSFVDGILADGTVASVLQVGLRDIEHPGNVGEGGRLVALSPRRTRRVGARGLASMIPAGLPVYLSVDIDVLTPEVAPATRTPVPGGFAYDELLELLELVAGSARIVGVDLMELDPSRDRHDQTVHVALQLLLGLLGLRYAATTETY